MNADRAGKQINCG